MLLCATMVAFSSCEKDDVSEEPKIVDVCFDVQFPQSGTMTRGGSEVYLDFYNNHIKTKNLVPKSYSLTIKNEVGEIIASLNGNWDMTSFRLPIGKYRIEGRSSGNLSMPRLEFNEEINITTSGTITLTAQYGCFLLIFPSNNEESYKYSIREYGDVYKYNDLPKVDNICYMFIENITTFNSITCTIGQQYFTISLSELSSYFKNGFYYYFDTISGSFNVPPMPNGSI